MKWVCILACCGLLSFVQACNRGSERSSTSSGGYDDSECTDQGGVCQMTYSSCSGSYRRNLCGGPSNRRCCISGANEGCRPTQMQSELACELFWADNVIAARHHPSGETDDAYPYNNLRDVCQGNPASRSSYYCNNGCFAPGGTTCLSTDLLRYLVNLKNTGEIIRINELAGACHSCDSKHYLGLAVDLHRPDEEARHLYVTRCQLFGGWADNERTHVHCQFRD